MQNHHSRPVADPARFTEWLDAIGIDSMLVVIRSKMSKRLLARHEPGDVWGETMVMAWRDRVSFSGDSVRQFRAWLLRIAIHRIHDLADARAARKRRAEANACSLHDLTPPMDSARSAPLDLPCVSTTPGQCASHKERAAIMDEALASLSKEHEAILRLHLFEQKPMVCVARELGLKLSTAWTRFRRGAELYASRLDVLESRSRSRNEAGLCGQ